MLLWPTSGFAGSSQQETEVEQALKKLRTRIKELNLQLNAAQTTKTSLEASLKQTELAIGDASNELHRLKYALKTQQGMLKELQHKQETESNALREQRDRLARQLRVAYAMGQQDVLKVLLNQQEPATMARLIAYHRYVTNLRARQIEDAMARVARLQRVELEVKEESETLEALRREQIKTRRQLEGQRSSRAVILSRLQAKIRRDGQEIAQLERDKDGLEELLEGIREALKLSDIPDTPDQGKPFAALKGKLEWPSTGSILHRFGMPRRPGSLNGKVYGSPAPGGSRSERFGTAGSPLPIGCEGLDYCSSLIMAVVT